jgi:acid phosphatase type 7
VIAHGARWLGVLLVALAARPAAVADGPGQHDGSLRYLNAGSELEWLSLRAPNPGQRLGAIAAGEIDRAAAAARGASPPAAPGLEGAPAAAPSGWPGALDGARRGRAPLGARGLDGQCDCATEVGDESDERVAALFAQTSFTVGDDIDRVRLLHLRMRYSDGAIAYINGREVLRRGLARDATGRLAARPSGPEWETFYIPAGGLLRRGLNRLAVEVRPSSISRSPLLDLELDGRSGARIVRGPIVQWTGPTSAALSFDTDLPARAEVTYSVGRESGSRVARSAGGGFALHHRVELGPLAPAAAVRYRVAAGGDVTPERVFHTAPSGGVVRFAVYGDTRGGHAVHARIVDSLLAEAPDFVVVTGDMVLRGSDEGGWQRFFQITGELLGRVPYLPAAGNHDIGRAGDEQRRMGEIFALPPAAGPPRPEWAHWYSFDVGGVHFAMLDSNAYEAEEQLAWLRADLAAARTRGQRALFAAVHDGPYSRGIHGGSQIARERYAPILAEYGVVMLFAGHDHLYQRGEAGRLRYIVSGGGGAPLYPVRCGARGQPRCTVADGAEIAVSEHHYVLVTVQGDYAQVCARRPDRTPLEKCVRYRLPPARR